MAEEMTQTKSFWKKPEGKVGALITIAAVIFGGYVLIHALPTIIFLLENTIYAIILGVVVFALIMTILNPKARALAWYAYRGFFRTATGFIITIDPVKILKNYIVSLKESMEKANVHIRDVSAQMSKLRGQVEDNVSDIEKNLAMARAADKQNKAPQATSYKRQAARLEDSNERLTALYTKLENVYKVLTKISDTAEVLLQDTQNEVSVREKEYNAIKSAHSAFKSAMNIITGDPDKKEIFDQAMELVIDDVRTKVGDMDYYMERAAKALSTVDIQNGVFEEKGFDLLQQWDTDKTVVRTKAQAALSKKSDSLYSRTGKF